MQGPIIDAHHHVWRLDRTPWLHGPIAPRIFGDYAPLKRDYLAGEYAAAVRPLGVVASVHVQANLAPADAAWECEWAAREGAAHGVAQAVVGYAELAAPDVGDLLDRQLAVAPLRGVRQQLHWHARPDYRYAATPDGFLHPDWQRGLRAVGARGLHFELQVFPGQYADALRLIDRHPHTMFVLLHAGMPDDPSPVGVAAWRDGLRRFHARENVLAKLSGLGTFSRSCSTALWRPLIVDALDAFGPARCLFGSNLPIETLWSDVAHLFGVVHACLAHLSESERRAVLHDTAARLYKITA